MAAKFDMIIAAKTTGQAAIKRMGNSMQGLQGRLKNVRMAALSVNTAFKAMALILTAGAFSRVVTGAINQADAFGKLSRQTGIAADSLQAYVNAGKLAGVEQATIEKGLRRLAQSQREADQGIKTYSESYEALGISVRDSDGNLKSSEILLGDIADRFSNMPNGATKAALAMEIFGRSGAQLIPMLNEGRDALEEWNYETSEGFAANAEYFNDQITMLKFGFDGFRKQLADALLPTLNNLLGMFRNIFSSKNDWDGLFKGIEVGLKIISSSVFTVVAGFRFLLTTIQAIATGLGELAQGNFGAAKDAFGAGLKKTNEQFKKDMEVFNQIWTGDENAPASYFAEGTEQANILSTQLDKSFGTQMQAKITSFKNSIKSVGESMADVVIKGVKGMEDALVNFVMTGKLEFRSLANSIIRDMVRITIQQAITAPFSNFIGGLFKTPSPAPFKNVVSGKAMGGPVMGGKSYLVGEQGPEIFSPTTSGNITPNHQLGNTSVVVNVDAKGDSQVQGDQGQASALGKLISAAVTSELVRQKRPGGLLSPA
ncbi:MAG: hypothetical protein CMC15_17920 [Flavobacteriaceae bacterium]|nr:hypothetical protein [Flavobacteriaceae bacterium]